MTCLWHDLFSFSVNFAVTKYQNKKRCITIANSAVYLCLYQLASANSEIRYKSVRGV